MLTAELVERLKLLEWEICHLRHLVQAGAETRPLAAPRNDDRHPGRTPGTPDPGRWDEAKYGDAVWGGK